MTAADRGGIVIPEAPNPNAEQNPSADTAIISRSNLMTPEILIIA
ncbi:MAG: hypothetical protein ACI4SF_03450 [Oscillospiraceae bacterium]